MTGKLKAGVMGWPVAHSLSPALHGHWLARYGIAGRYDAIPVRPEDLQAALAGLHEQGFRGVNLTVPHKEAALGFVDAIDDTARRIGAVNTIILGDDGSLSATNTDAYGLIENIRALAAAALASRFNDRPAVILGAGGAARAAVVGLADAGLLINTSTLGMAGQPPLELDLARLPSDAVVNDIVYAPLETDLLAAARARGNIVVDGLGMLLHQARAGFRAWFGVDPAVDEELRTAVLAARDGRAGLKT